MLVPSQMFDDQRSLVIQRRGAVWPFGEHLKGVLRCAVHDFENGFDERRRNRLVKQIRHGVHEHDPWPPPFQWFVQSGLVNSDPEPLFVFVQPHGPQSLGHALGITESAAVTDLGAARHRVPSHLGPFDRRERVDMATGGPGYAWRYPSTPSCKRRGNSPICQTFRVSTLHRTAWRYHRLPILRPAHSYNPANDSKCPRARLISADTIPAVGRIGMPRGYGCMKTETKPR